MYPNNVRSGEIVNGGHDKRGRVHREDSENGDDDRQNEREV